MLFFMGREKVANIPVVTFLHEFGHALGKNEVQTCTWSINLFKKKSFSRIVCQISSLKVIYSIRKCDNI